MQINMHILTYVPKENLPNLYTLTCMHAFSVIIKLIGVLNPEEGYFSQIKNMTGGNAR